MFIEPGVKPETDMSIYSKLVDEMENSGVEDKELLAKNLWHLLLTNRINMIANMPSNTKLGNGMDMDNQEGVANHKDTTPIVQGPLKNDEEQVNLAAIAKNHERIRSV